MTMLATIPALIRIALIFLVIIIAIRKNVSLANGFLAGSLMLAVFFRLSPPDTAGSVWSCLSDPKTLSLCVIIALILVFSKSLEDCGQLKRLLDNFQGLVKSPRLNLAVFP